MALILIALTIIVLLIVFLYFKFNSKVVIYVILAFALVFLIALILNFFSPAIFASLFESEVEKKAAEFSSAIPINPFLNKALSAVFVLINAYAVLCLTSIRQNKKIRGVLIFACSFIAFQLICYFVVKDQIFPYMKCADNLQGGYEFVEPNVKIDPNYNTPVCDCTPEMILSIKGKKAPKVNRITISSETTFFTYDGRPLIWYYQYPDGKLEFFNRAGFHPQLGILLKPVNEEIVSKALGYINDGNSKMIMTDHDEKSISNYAVVKSNYYKEKKKEGKPEPVNFISHAIHNSNGTAVEILENNKLISSQMSEAITEIYNQNGKVAYTGLFNFDSLNNNIPNSIFKGDTELLRKFKLCDYTKYLVVGELNYTIANGTLSEGTLVCTASLTIDIIDAKNYAIIKNFIISEKYGNGVTESQAKDAAFQKIETVYSNQYASF